MRLLQTGHPLWRSPNKYRFSHVVLHSYTRDVIVEPPPPPPGASRCRSAVFFDPFDHFRRSCEARMTVVAVCCCFVVVSVCVCLCGWL